MRTMSLLHILAVVVACSGCDRPDPPPTPTTTSTTKRVGNQQTTTAPTRAPEAEEQAVVGIEKWGGKVKRDGDAPNAPVVEVAFNRYGEIFTDAVLEHLKGLKQLQKLDFSYTKMTSADLRHLQGLTQLQILNLSDTKVDDWGLEYLKGLNQLQKLDLESTHVTEAAMKKLQESLPKCVIIR